ncbi:MAG: BrnT family toxin [Paracoccaceae bacterium]
MTRADLRRDYGEERFITVGFLDNRLVVVAWTQRKDAWRVISMRKANGREQGHYIAVLG